ncbi:MAG: hypothetical protein RL357_1266 [Pseudomonadota bacterium]
MGASMTRKSSTLRRLAVLALGLGLLMLLARQTLTRWVDSPLHVLNPEQSALVVVAPGASAKQVANAVVQAGVDVPTWALYAWFRWSGQSRQIQAGTYEFTPPLTPNILLSKLAKGDQALARITFIEGWTFRQMRQAMAQAPAMKHETEAWSDAQIMAEIGMAGIPAEGRFFPDTYVYPKNSSDLGVYRQAARAMQTKLDAAWQSRSGLAALDGRDDLLILASMIEKETQHYPDRQLISAVFHNRLRLGMKLQSDPTIIYGLGEAFDGDLKRVHLRTDSPYNSYTRFGLPPTPIAMPSEAALFAAANPAESKALFFVGKGDGSSHFSETLSEHNAAVRQFILKR